LITFRVYTLQSPSNAWKVCNTRA